MKNFRELREIYTPFFSNKADEILRSVLGQLSDGLWENSRGYERYWLNFNVERNADGQVYFAVSKDYYKVFGGDCYTNPFIEMTDAEFLNWVSNKLKAVVVAEFKNNPNNFTGGGWKRNNTMFESCYLSYNEKITVADIYVIYDWLKGRKLDMRLPIVKDIFSNPRSEDQTKKIKDMRSKIDFIQDNAEHSMDEIKETYNERIANLEAQIAELKDEMNNKCVEISHDAYLKVKAIREEIEKISA